MSDLYQLPPRHPSERSISDINKAANRYLQSFDEIREEDFGTPVWLDETLKEVKQGNRDSSRLSRIAIFVAVLALLVSCISLWRTW